MVEIIIFI